MRKLCVSFILLELFYSFVLAQTGDLCSNSIPISTIPFTYSGNTAGFASEQNCATSNTAADIWFSYIPTTSTFVDVGTCSSSSYDSVIYIVSGTCTSYTCLRSDDNTCNSNSQALVLGHEFQVGITYYIIVSGFGTAEGAFTLSITPVTSGCTSAQTITSLPFTISGSLSSGRSEPCRAGSFSQWYTYTPPGDVHVQLSTCGSASFDTLIYVASGTCPDSLSCFAFNDDASPACAVPLASRLDVPLSYNVQYYFAVTSVNNYIVQPAGSYSLSITILPPVNNICSGATEITSLPFSTVGMIDEATQDFSCLIGTISLPSASVDVWYSFTPSTNYANVAISTCGSSIRSFLYLSTGACGASRSCLLTDSGSCPYGTATGYLQTPMQSGTTYYIAVAPLLSTGTYQLQLTIAPSNDQCYGAIRISSLPYSFTGTTATAKWDFTCPQSVRQGRDIFFYFTPPVEYYNVAVDLCGSNYDTYAYIASGTCNSLTCLAYNDDGSSCALSQSYLTYPTLEAGRTYFFIVTGNCIDDPSCYGSVSLSITGSATHSCYGPTVVGSIPYSFSATTTATPGDFSCTAGDVTVNAVTGNYWFVFIPTVTYNNVFIDVCSASFDAALFYVTGDCDNLQCSSLSTGDSEYCNVGSGRGTLIADVTLNAGISHFFVVTGLSPDAFGSFTLTISIDTSSFVSILAPVAGSILGGPILEYVEIYGTSGTYDALSTVTLTISSSTNVVIVYAIVDFDSTWYTVVDLRSMSDGPIVLDAYLVDPRGNVATASTTFTKDGTTFVFITSPGEGALVNEVTSPILQIQGTGEVGGSVIVTLTDGSASTARIVSSPVTVAPDRTWSVSVDISGLSDGAIRIIATITDPLGNMLDSPTVTITKDTALSIYILVPSDFQFIISEARAPYLTISGFADAGAYVFVVISDATLTQTVDSKTVTATIVETWSVTVDVSSLNDGNLIIVASAADEANNVVTSQTITLEKDTLITPATTISSPSDGDTVSGSQVSALLVSGTGEPNSQISLRISGTVGVINRTITISAGGVWSTTVNIANLPNGPITIGGLTTDVAENSASIPSIVVTKM